MKSIVTVLSVAALGGSLVATSATHAAAFDAVPSQVEATPVAAASAPWLLELDRLPRLWLRQLQVVEGGAGITAGATGPVSEASLDVDRAVTAEPQLRLVANPTCQYMIGCGRVLNPLPQAAPAGGEQSLDAAARVSP
jgi:hypothetical protein